MADIIDLALVTESRKFLKKLLDERGLNYFLRHDARRPFQLEPQKVDLVIRTAARSRSTLHAGRARLPTSAYAQARKAVRRELIRRVVAEMVGVGL